MRERDSEEEELSATDFYFISPHYCFRQNIFDLINSNQRTAKCSVNKSAELIEN